MRHSDTFHRQAPESEVPTFPHLGEASRTMSYVQLLLITLIAACTAIYLATSWHRTEAQCASAYLYTVDCAPGQVLGEYVIE